MSAPLPLKRGHFVWVTFQGKTMKAMVVLASDNSVSLMLMFDGTLGSLDGADGGMYAGMMPVLWEDGRYVDLVKHAEATITPYLL